MSDPIKWRTGELKILLDDGSELVLRLGANGKDIHAERKRDGVTQAVYGQTWPWDEWPDSFPFLADIEESHGLF
tara:strand:- start:3426 stop:3647 length:222 start_codon:yes stop_codon:yes gene_type:complete